MIACEKNSRGNNLTLARAGADFLAGSTPAWCYANENVRSHLEQHGFVNQYY